MQASMGAPAPPAPSSPDGAELRAAEAEAFEETHVATPGPSLYAPQVTKTGGGLLGDSPQYTFRGDAQPRSFIDNAFVQSSSPGPAYNPLNLTVAKAPGPSFSFGNERRAPSPYGKDAPGPNSYRVKGNQHGGGEMGEAPKFGFGTREQTVRPEAELDRVPYIDREHERENHGVFSPGPAAYTPRESLHRKVHQPNSPVYTMRPHLKYKVRSDGVALSWAKVSGGPGPGASNPHVNNKGGGYMGDAPTHKIGTGIKIPHPATNLKKLQYYGSGFDRTYQGLFSPGPATYSPGDRYIGGKGKRREGPSFSFGSAPRPCTAVYGKEPSVSPRVYSQRRTPSFSSWRQSDGRRASPRAPSSPRTAPTSPYASQVA